MMQGITHRCFKCGEETVLSHVKDRQTWECSVCGMEWPFNPEIKKGYSSLQKVLEAAQAQAESGKGHERHASDEAFEDQPIQWIEKHFKSFQLGQAVKKMHESQRLDKDAAIKELLGAINYLAARVIYLEGGAR